MIVNNKKLANARHGFSFIADQGIEILSENYNMQF